MPDINELLANELLAKTQAEVNNAENALGRALTSLKALKGAMAVSPPTSPPPAPEPPTGGLTPIPPPDPAVTTPQHIDWSGRKWRVNSDRHPYSIQLGEGISRFEIRPGETRAELSGSIYGDKTRLPNGVPLWGAFEFVHQSWADPAGMSNAIGVLGQVHIGSSFGGSPALAFRRVRNGNFAITTRGEFETTNNVRWRGPVSFDQPHKLVYRVVFHPTAGELQVWLDGTKLVDVTGASIGHSNAECYWNIGAYFAGGVTCPVVAEYRSHVYPNPTPLPGFDARPTPAPAPSPTPSPAPSGGIDLSNWKITLPVDSGGKFAGTASEVLKLAGFSRPPYFLANADGSLTFRAPVEGATTSGSSYARTELREMKGAERAAWKLTEGGSMVAALTVDEAPIKADGKPGRVIVGQIHGQDHELIRLYWENGQVYFKNDRAGPSNSELRFDFANAAGEKPNVGLGEPFAYSIHAKGSTLDVKVHADGHVYTSRTPINAVWQSDTFYFKAGTYLGVNETQGTGWGQTTFRDLRFTHSGEAL